MAAKPKKIQLYGQVQWLISESAAGNLIGVCQPLALTAQGQDLNELYENINEALQLVLTDVLKQDKLDTYLRLHGWSSNSNEVERDVDVEFDVPIDLLMRSSSDRPYTTH